LTKLDAAAGGANDILGENRAAIRSFANDGLSQLGPTLAEFRALVRDLRGSATASMAVRTLHPRPRCPKEFEPK
jgi:phospholipid/cholesterol/gamma-HCH transport system substrate-binding protein